MAQLPELNSSGVGQAVINELVEAHGHNGNYVCLNKNDPELQKHDCLDKLRAEGLVECKGNDADSPCVAEA